MVIEYSGRVVEIIPKEKGQWNHLKIGVFAQETDGPRKGIEKLIGQYERNYGSFYKTFFPFKSGEKWYALYSRYYTGTRVMKLPECIDLGGENHTSFGFCPVEYYVPKIYLVQNGKPEETTFAPFGFVAGCVWADNASWKIEFIDLRHVAEGKIKRDNRMDYIALPRGKRLEECIENVKVHSAEEFSFDITSTVSYTYSWTDKIPMFLSEEREIPWEISF